MKVTYNKTTSELTIVIKAHESTVSKSGRTMLIASESQKAAVEVNGKEVTVAVNAYHK